MQNFGDRLAAAVRARGNPVCVGLDPRHENLPAALVTGIGTHDWPALARAYATFCREVIDVVAGLVPIVKPQAAFFEQLGPAGMQALLETIAYARQRGLLVLLDGKRNDIGTTAAAYAAAYLGPDTAWGCDALTVSPYLGTDSLTPFVDAAARQAAGIFVLVKTSNPGGTLFQDRACDGEPLYRHVARHVEHLAAKTAGVCGYGSVGAVVGATYPEQLVELRAVLHLAWILVPGYGLQGGTARDVQGAFDSRGLGAIVNNSRGILFAYEREPYRARYGEARWQDAVADATRTMIDELRSVCRLT